MKDKIQPPKNTVTKKVYQFDNYREFLKAYFKEQKQLKSIFSHRYFAHKAGFSSSSFCSHLITGKRNITGQSIHKLIRGLGLKGKAALYFENLILFNQSKTHAERDHYYTQLNRLRRGSKFYKLSEAHYPLFHEWYYPVIRELAVYANWKGDYKILGDLVRPKVKSELVRKAVKALLACGLLNQKRDGSWERSEPALSAVHVPHSILKNYKKQNLLKALEATELMGREERHVSSITVSISEKTSNEIEQLMDETRKKIMEMALNDVTVNKVFQVNFQSFPLSENIES